MRTTVLTWLICLAVIDVVIPVPILALVLIWVVVRKPAWFMDVVRKVYAG
ncbi:MAG TPA: hypothetical protein VKU85_02310 [bacterium]|nr:hypothetical protein [bacterium]